MINLIANPSNLTALLAKAQPGDTIQLVTGAYPGEYTLTTPNVTIEPALDALPIFTGPPSPIAGTKPIWIHITESAKGSTLRNLSLIRDIAIVKVKLYNDYGIVVEAPAVTIDSCRLAGMVKGIHVKDKTSTGFTIARCHIGPTYQSNIAIGTSYGAMRGGLIGWNLLEGSYIEDGIQFTQNFAAANPDRDVSNLGVAIVGNVIQDQAENAIDLKGAAYVVIDGNVIRRIYGSNDGPLNGWNTRSPMAITHGAGASIDQVCPAIVRNNLIEDCAGGVRVWPGWKVYNNTIRNNNNSMTGQPWAGTGILLRNGTQAVAIKNNLVSGHRGADLDIVGSSPDFDCNPHEPGAGVALTTIRGGHGGRVISVKDASYFTDWFGRGDLPRDVACVSVWNYTYEVISVDYAANTLTPNDDTVWQDGDPIFWRSPQPVAGIQPEYKPVEPLPGPTEPTTPPEPETPLVDPPMQPVTLTLSLTLDLAPGLADVLREAIGRAMLHVELEDALPPGAVIVYDPGDD